jgi:DNA-binding GntR family transcriptional regulator
MTATARRLAPVVSSGSASSATAPKGAQATAPGPAQRSAPSLRDQAYEAIKHQIITCVFKPGQAINEAQVALLLGLGRTPVHQALDRLMVEELVDILPRKGVVVRPLSLSEVLQITDARLVNEAHCARLAATHVTAAETRQLDGIVERARKATARRDVEALVTLDRTFHTTLMRAARNPVFEDIVRRLQERSLRFWFIALTAQEQREAVQCEHAAIVDALRDRNPDAAEAAARCHIESFLQMISHCL